MLGDLFKIFVDEPEKLSKAAIKGVKIILNLIMASYLYKLVFGPYEIFQFGNYSQWADFLLSGRVLICILFYLLSEFILFPLVSGVAYLPILVTSKIEASLIEHKDVKLLLRTFNIVKYGKQKEIPEPGPNFDFLYEITKSLEDKETQREVRSLRNTFIANVWDLYSAFVIVYFLTIKSHFQNYKLDIIVLTTFVLLFITYYIIHGAIEFILKNYRELSHGLGFIKANKAIYDMLAEYGIFPRKPEKDDVIKKGELFEFNSNEYVLHVVFSKGNRPFGKLTDMAQKFATKNKRLLLITNQKFNVDDYAQIRENSNILTVISFEGEEDLIKKLKTELDDKASLN